MQTDVKKIMLVKLSMEEFNQQDWVWLGVAPGTDDCVFCGKIVMNEHLSSCPSQMINITEGTIDLWTHINNDERTEDERHADIGKSIMYAADIIIRSQKEWGMKHTLSKYHEVLNNWGMINEFAEVLQKLGYLETAEEVINFYKKPTEYERIYIIWEEYDFCFFDDDTWIDFSSVVDSLNDGDTI
jgi:hypothetical protein|tara:strand:- start:6031 stop:6585 length:555 start_codon:yes stop_codon:yes gene_type:complete